MGTSAPDLAHALLALGTLLVAALVVGHAFAMVRQPRVIGEICGGLLLGPTLFGAVVPSAHSWLYGGAHTHAVVGIAYDLGLILLMFVSGAEMRRLIRREDQQTVALVAFAGVVLPLMCGIALFRILDTDELLGPADNRTALLIVFALGIAVTSIPVISRIFLDLGIMDTPFARIVVSVAVLEDIVVYVLLAVALGMVSGTSTGDLGPAGWLGLQPGGAAALATHVLCTALFFLLMLTAGVRAFRWGARHFTGSSLQGVLGYHLVFLLLTTLVALGLGLAPLFGAFLTGIVAASVPGDCAARAREMVKDVSLAVFVPVYFAIVGLHLDLIRHFDVTFFLAFALLACLVKSLSVFLGARLAGEGPHGARNLAVATNARGGPGIVLASVSLSAGIISEEFYASLVMLAVVTSLLAGTWLGHVVRAGLPLREERCASVEPPRRVSVAGEQQSRPG